MVSMIPQTLEEALELLHNDEYCIVAGGTDLLVQKRSWSSTPPAFEQSTLFIKHLSELRYIKKVGEWILIGALATLEDLLQSEHTPAIYKDALYEMASVNIRNEATIAGNIENASPAGDSLPVLYCLDAVIVLKSLHQTREVLITDYITGLRKTARKSDELITEIKIPVESFTHKRWTKVGGRKADAISKLSFVGLANILDNVVLDFRVAFGAVSPTVVRNKKIEEQYINQPLDKLKKHQQEILDAYDQLISPVDNQRSTKVYRRQVSLNILKDFIDQL